MARKRLAQRVRIVLMSTKPISAAKIADQLGIVRLTVYKWRSRYRESGLEGLKDRSRPGRPLKKRPPIDGAVVAIAPVPTPEPPASSRPPS
jgi:transposase